jgi:hypothetical protein
VHESNTHTRTDMTPALRCAHCGFHPASPRIGGYCSWDCYEAADDQETDADGEQALLAWTSGRNRLCIH